MKKVIIGAVACLVLVIAGYNVYGVFQAQKAKRVAQIEQQRQAEQEAQRLAEERRWAQERERAEEKAEQERRTVERKIKGEQRLAQYEFLKQARKNSKEDKYVQRRVEAARSLSSPEGLPRNIVQAMQRATYLTIRNNPEDYRGDYTPQSLLRSAKLTDGGANSLMMFSMISTDLKVIEEVIKLGYDINTQNKSGYTALMFASAYNSSEVVEFLLGKGAKSATTEYLSEGNALHVSARYNPKPEVLEVLVKNGFDLEAKDKDGNTALLIATKYNKNLQVVEKLIELGADNQAADSTGNVSYSHALERVERKAPMGRYEFISDEYQNTVLMKLKP
jgi:hypothetical protein